MFGGSKIRLSVFGLFIFLAFSGGLQAGRLPTTQIGDFPFYTGLIGVPEDDYQAILLPGTLERARANLELAADVYGECKFCQEIPALRKALDGHPSYFVELVGRLRDRHFARMIGLDKWRLKNGEYRVGEENGGNVGGSEFMLGGAAWLKEQGKFGEVPFNEDLARRFVSHIQDLAESFFGNSEPHTIVIADEASIRSEKVEVSEGKFVEPPFALNSDFIHLVRKTYQQAGAEWVSLVDDRGRLFVHEGVLYLRDAHGSGKKKVDALWTMADLESMDPNHRQQWERNTRAHKEKLNENALLVGIPGLIEAWVEGKAGGFLWVNNPTSALTRTKLWPIMVDQLITKRKGQPPILPYQKTYVFVNPDGSFNEALVASIRENPQAFVYKLAVGDGGKEVWIGSEFADRASALKFLDEKFLPWARSNPLSVLAQDEVELDKIKLSDGSERVFDIRQLALISGSDSTFRATPNRHIFIRLAPLGKRKVNISGGGAFAIGTPAPVRTLQAMPPLRGIGVNQSTYPHTMTSEEASKLLEDGRDRALVEAYLLRDIYYHPEKLFRDFPALEYIVKASGYYRPEHFKHRKSSYPTYFLSGDDKMQKTDGSYTTIEHNVTNVGGLIRLWWLRSPGIKSEMRRWLKELRSVWYQAKRPTGISPRPMTVYFLEATHLGAPWLEVKQKFKKDFGVVLASKQEVEEGRFKVQNDFLYYRNDQGAFEKVDIFFSHMEPDFVDPSVASDEALLKIMTPEELAERRAHSIAGINRVLGLGNLVVVNETGQDVVCSKAILPFYAALRKYYLGKDEVVPTQQSVSFVNDQGQLREDVLRDVESDPTSFVIKNGEITGNAGGVFILRNMDVHERAALLKAIRLNPAHFVRQELATSKKNLLGFHSEVRAFTLVKISLDSDGPAEVVGQMPEIYVRAAEGNRLANLLPSKEAQAAGVTPGFRVPGRIVNPCAKALAVMGDPSI